MLWYNDKSFIKWMQCSCEAGLCKYEDSAAVLLTVVCGVPS